MRLTYALSMYRLRHDLYLSQIQDTSMKLKNKKRQPAVHIFRYKDKQMKLS